MTIARIENDAVVEFRELALTDVPQHKRHLWRPVVYEGEGAASQTIIEPAQVRVVRAVPTPTREEYGAAVERHVDAVARQRGYSSAVSMASYTNSSVPRFAAEAIALRDWRDSVWVTVAAIEADVLAGRIPPPAVNDLLTQLPAIKWPQT